MPVRAAPSNERDLVISAENAHVLCFDNVSGVSDAMSDALCRLATGGGFGTRQLYTGRGEELFYLSKPMILNGIVEIATRPDLADRMLRIMLQPIPDDERRTEAELNAAFEADRSAILGGLLDAVSASLRYRGEVKLSRLPRLADFAVNATAASRLFGEGLPAFMDAYSANRLDAVLDAAANSPIVQPIEAFMRTTMDGEWEGTMTDLMEEAALFLPQPDRPPRQYPRTGSAMANEMQRVAPVLRALGIRREELPREGPSGRRVFRLVLEERQ